MPESLTSRNKRETTDPVSDCSPTDFSCLEGVRDKMRTTGAPVDSCRNDVSDEMRWCIRIDRRRGRKGRYAERKRRPSVTAGKFR